MREPAKVHNPRAMGRRVVRRRIVPLVAVALFAAALAPAARADGDPASDYLLTNQVFLTSQSGTASPAQRQLVAAVRAANLAGFAIRVAVVATDYDVGSITALWRKPALYARFLGQELEGTYRGRLLVVMPNGFGFNWPGHPAAAAYRALAAVPAAGVHDASVAAQDAVRRLASAAGVTLRPIPRAGAARRSTGSDIVAILGGVLGGLALGAAALLALRGLRRRSYKLRLPAPQWAIPGAVVLCAAAAAVPILALRRSGVSSAQVASVVTPPPLSWPAGTRAAPGFVLRDQSGQSVSVAGFRGRPVIVTFIDPLCRNLCPLEAQILNQVDREAPGPERPVILAVSVDRWANTRADLLQDVREWHLVPQWRWAVGRPAQLASVWKRYAVGVSVVTKHVATTTIHYITHTEAAYVIDGSGHERALFVWPFYPQDVMRVLRRLA